MMVWRIWRPRDRDFLYYTERTPSILFRVLSCSLNFPTINHLSYLSPRSSVRTDLLLVLLCEWLVHDTWPATQHPSLQISATLYFSLSFRRRPSLRSDRFTGFSWITRGFVGNLHRLQLFSLAWPWASESPLQVGLYTFLGLRGRDNFPPAWLSRSRLGGELARRAYPLSSPDPMTLTFTETC